jgi:hypothetical protein
VDLVGSQFGYLPLRQIRVAVLVNWPSALRFGALRPCYLDVARSPWPAIDIPLEIPPRVKEPACDHPIWRDVGLKISASIKGGARRIGRGDPYPGAVPNVLGLCRAGVENECGEDREGRKISHGCLSFPGSFIGDQTVCRSRQSVPWREVALVCRLTHPRCDFSRRIPF